MRLKKTSSSQHSSLNHLNITPLLDLVFVLLVIFIITTPQMMNNLEMNLPSPKPPQNTPPPKPDTIVVDAKGQTFLNDQPVTIPELKTKLQELKKTNPDLPVVVNGSDEVYYQSMVSVLDVLQQLDITKVGLQTAATEAAGP